MLFDFWDNFKEALMADFLENPRAVNSFWTVKMKDLRYLQEREWNFTQSTFSSSTLTLYQEEQNLE